jgi:hypothetical protein
MKQITAYIQPVLSGKARPVVFGTLSSFVRSLSIISGAAGRRRPTQILRLAP